MTSIRYGLIGYGLFGKHHANAIANCEGATLAAISAKSANSREAAQADHPTADTIEDYHELLARDDSRQFWTLQIIGWSGLSVISFLSLNLWYDQPEAAYLGHNVLQSVLVRDMLDQIVISSFDPRALVQARHLNAEIGHRAFLPFVAQLDAVDTLDIQAVKGTSDGIKAGRADNHVKVVVLAAGLDAGFVCEGLGRSFGLM